MRGDVLGIASRRFVSEPQREVLSVYCLPCARRMYGDTIVRQVLAAVPMGVPYQQQAGQSTLVAVREGIDAIVLYRNQYCHNRCDPQDPRAQSALCPGKAPRDYSRDAVRAIVEELEAQQLPVTVSAIARAHDHLLAAGHVNEYIQASLEELYPERYPPARGQEVMIWLDDSSIVWSNADFLCQYDTWKYRTEFPGDGAVRALWVPEGEEAVIEVWLHRDGPTFQPPFPDRSP